MWKILKMASAFIGIIVGAGFASGQEVLQYFTSFGLLGIAGAILSATLFAYLGMTIARIGSRLKTVSHKEAIYQISGRYVGVLVDYIIIFTLFVVGVVMIAGAGSNLHQQFGLPTFVGSLLLVVLVGLTILLSVDKVVSVIGSITPFLILAIVGISIFCLLKMDTTFSVLDPVANNVPTTLPNWFVSSINYVSFNIAVGASMTFVMGGAEANEKIAKWGGFFGGLGLGILILLSHLAIFSRVDVIADAKLPMLAIMNDISPILAIGMAVILYGMIFNTAVSMFYAFGARFISVDKPSFKWFIFATLTIGFALSFEGFTELVAYFYPLIGYLGLFLVGALIIASFRLPKRR